MCFCIFFICILSSIKTRSPWPPTFPTLISHTFPIFFLHFVCPFFCTCLWLSALFLSVLFFCAQKYCAIDAAHPQAADHTAHLQLGTILTILILSASSVTFTQFSLLSLLFVSSAKANFCLLLLAQSYVQPSIRRYTCRLYNRIKLTKSVKGTFFLPPDAPPSR